MDKRIIHSVFEDTVTRFPDSTAVRFDGKSLTYTGLNERANALAHCLRQWGMKREAVASTLLPSGIPLVVSLLGVFKSSGVWMPLDIQFSGKKIEEAWQQSEARFCITDLSWESQVKQLLQELDHQIEYLIVLDDDEKLRVLNVKEDFKEMHSEAAYSNENPELLNEPADSNYIFYTSGSSGKSKAILGSHISLSHCIHWQIKEFGVAPGFVVSQLSQSTFDACLRDLLVPLCAGAVVSVPTQETKGNLEALVQWMTAEAVTLIHTVPSFFRAIVKQISTDPKAGAALGGALKHVLLAGEPLFGRDIRMLQQAIPEQTPELVNLYGATEATMYKTFHRVKTLPEDDQAAIHAGKPIGNTLIALISDDKLCAKGQIGEIYIVTPFLSKGYFKDEQRTNAAFVQNPLVKDRKELVYKTGDYGRYLEDGSLEVLGRIDDQVKVNGIRVELNEVKEAVLALEGVTQTELLVHTNEEYQKSLLCYYTGSVESEALRGWLKKQLNENVVPSAIIKMDEFPLTLNGKVDKKALPLPEDILLNSDNYEPVSGKIEETLEALCMEILSLKKMGRHASFFNLGGTSLKAIQYISSIYKKFGVWLNVKDVFEHETIAKFADFLEKRIVNKSVSDQIPPLEEAEYYELSHAQKRLWLMEEMYDTGATYNMALASRIAGKLDQEVLRDVITQLVVRHEILRTSLILTEGEVRQKVDREIKSLPFIVTDLRGKAETLDQEIQQAADTPFDLSESPLFRAHLFQTGDEEYVFLMVMHHIIADGWSMEILSRECFELYAALSEGKEPELEKLNVHYKDFAAWQNKVLELGDLSQLEAYWSEQLAGEVKGVEVRPDFSSEETHHREGRTQWFEITHKDFSKLKKISADNGVTLFTLMTSMMFLLLSKFTGQDDLVIGTPATARKHPDLQNLLGIFVNVLPLRIKSVRASKNFKAFLKQVNQVMLGASEHDLYPYDLMLEKAGIDDTTSQFPLINVLVQSQDEAFKAVETDIPGLQVSDYEVKTGTSKVDITFNFKQEEERMVGGIEYSSQLYAAATIDNLLSNLKHFIALLPEDGDLAIQDFNLLLDQEKEEEQDAFLQSMTNL